MWHFESGKVSGHAGRSGATISALSTSSQSARTNAGSDTNTHASFG